MLSLKGSDVVGPKPFTVITAFLLLTLAVFHLLRLIMGFEIAVAGNSVPIWGSTAHVLIFGLLSWGLFREARR